MSTSLWNAFLKFSRWRVTNIAGVALAGIVVCVALGPALLLYSLAIGAWDVVLASTGMVLGALVYFFFGPAVLIEWAVSRGRPAWRD